MPTSVEFYDGGLLRYVNDHLRCPLRQKTNLWNRLSTCITIHTV
jgi:hypothetical protein